MSARRSLDRLGELAPVQDEELAAQDLEASRERFLEAATRERPRARRFVAASGLAFAVAAAVLLFVFFPRSTSLSFAVGAARGDVGAWIAPSDQAPLPVRFSDGTTVVLDPSARARVVASAAHGARVLLESGRLTASVVHTSRSAWSFDVGPFEVLVTGTRFELEWDPAKERLKLVLREGSVAVSGPLVGARRAVGAGETLEVFGHDGRFELSRGESPALEHGAVEPAPPPAASSEAASPPAGASSGAASADVAPRRPTWRELAADNRYKDAMTAAEAEGFDAVVARSNAAELLMLADVARFSGQPGRATEALTATRTRFPGSGEAAKAAFHLGRVAFDQRRAYANAETWFTTYLGEQPGGAFAQEALGRIIECREAAGSTSGAEEAARRYLARYPAGPYAEHAKSLLPRE